MTGRRDSSPASLPVGRARCGMARATTAREASGIMSGLYRGFTVPHLRAQRTRSVWLTSRVVRQLNSQRRSSPATERPVLTGGRRCVTDPVRESGQ